MSSPESIINEILHQDICPACGDTADANNCPVCAPTPKRPRSLTPEDLMKPSVDEPHYELPNHRKFNVGESDYSKYTIQPWDIWKEYNLNPWDADIIKRTLRTKEGTSRVQDYQKIIHICTERIHQLENNNE